MWAGTGDAATPSRTLWLKRSLEKNVPTYMREAKFMFFILLIATIALWAYNLKRGWVL